MKQPLERRLAAILAADVAGYSRLMGATRKGRMNGSRRISGSSLSRRSQSIAGASSRPPATAFWPSSRVS
jgi:hypothetical protein